MVLRAVSIPILLAPLGCAATDGSACDPALRVAGTHLDLDAGGCGGASLEGTLRGEGLSLSFDSADDLLRPVVVAGAEGGTLRGVTLTGPWSLAGTQAPRWWRQGYQSWSWSGVTEVRTPELDGTLPTAGGDGDSLSVIAETPWTSWWGALLARPGGAALHLGAMSAGLTRVWFAVSPETMWVVWGERGEAVAVAPNATLALDPVRWSVGSDANALWEGWADEVSRGLGLAPPTPSPEAGWSDWYSFYGGATEADILANAAIAADHGLDLVQVDDGWERAWGDWQANDRFPSGMPTLADDLAALGVTPGLWMAPFYVDRATTTWKEHPDWFVRGSDGEPLGSVSCDCGVLDVTHPDAAAWMQAQVAAQVSAGFSYLKLDFLYAGALEGERASPVTGMQAYALGVALLRSAAGNATILACGAPLLPSVGFADRYRTGADIANVGTPDPDVYFGRWQARATAARAFANGRWWWNDPDNLLVRAPLDDDQVSGAVAAQVASGGLWLLGDDLRTLPEDRLDLVTAPDLLALRGVSTAPTDPLLFSSGVDGGPPFEAADPDDRVPTTWAVGGATVLLNLGEAEAAVPGPGGTERLTGEAAGAGDRTLAPWAGEVWAAD